MMTVTTTSRTAPESRVVRRPAFDHLQGEWEERDRFNGFNRARISIQIRTDDDPVTPTDPHHAAHLDHRGAACPGDAADIRGGWPRCPAR